MNIGFLPSEGDIADSEKKKGRKRNGEGHGPPPGNRLPVGARHRKEDEGDWHADFHHRHGADSTGHGKGGYADDSQRDKHRSTDRESSERESAEDNGKQNPDCRTIQRLMIRSDRPLHSFDF